MNNLAKRLLLLATAVPFLSISSAQNVGIGEEDPKGKLEIKSNSTISYPQLWLVEDDDDYARLSFSSALRRDSVWTISARPNATGIGRMNFFYRSKGDLMTLTSEGRLGIGTASPTQKLDVNGSLNLNGQLNIGGNPGSAGQVLVSNGTGMPEWKTLSGTTVPKARFSALYEYKVDGQGRNSVVIYHKDYNMDEHLISFNTDQDSIIIKQGGLYHFDISFSFSRRVPGTERQTVLLYLGGRNNILYNILLDAEPVTLTTAPEAKTWHFSFYRYIRPYTSLRLLLSVGGPQHSGLEAEVQGQWSGHLVSD